MAGSSTSYSHLGPNFYRFAIEMSASFDPSEALKPLAKAFLTNIAKNHDLLLIENLSDFFTIF
jgi:hypothetical protein